MNISGTTQVLGIIGHPIEHVLSPVMHNELFQLQGLDWVYVPFNVQPAHLQQVIDGFRFSNIRGFNVTIPHKVSIIPLLDELVAYANQIGAVNTVKNDYGKLIGRNTDGEGAIQSLIEHDFPLNNSVITIHDLKYIIAPSFFPEFSISKKLYMSLSIRSSVKRARKVIVVSESTKEDLMRLFGVPAPKISVVPLAVGKRFAVSLNKEEIKIKLKKKGIHGKYFLFVGERRPHKNIVRLIEAFKIFKDRNSEKYQLVIVGKRYSNYTVPEQKIKELDLESNVIMVGYVPDEELPLYYQGAEMLVFPSIYEGFGIPILEAMACGIPVITSNISSMPEVAGNAAVLVNPYETNEIAAAMQRICSNRDLRKDLIAKGSKNVKRFSWEKTAEKTLSVYEESYMDGRK